MTTSLIKEGRRDWSVHSCVFSFWSSEKRKIKRLRKVLTITRASAFQFSRQAYLVSGSICVAPFSNPSATPTYFLNDILGTTLAVIHPDRIEVVPMTAFGKPLYRSPAPPANSAPADQSADLPSHSESFSPAKNRPEIPSN